MTVKGKVEPVSVYALRGSVPMPRKRRRSYELPIIGRRVELATLGDGLDAALARETGSIVGIAAEAGIGKSRLVAEFVRDARRRGVVVAFGECQAFGSKTSYGPWREIWRRSLRLDDALSESEQVLALERELAADRSRRSSRAHRCSTCSSASRSRTTSSRAPSRRSFEDVARGALADCLRARAAEEPLVLVLEDCHWIDPLSRDLLETLARVTASIRLSCC